MTSSLQFDPQERAELARRILHCLRDAVPGSTAELRGSLAEDRTDAYSDIDVLWEIDDDAWEIVDQVGAILAAEQPITSIRSDPDLQRSHKHRLLFVRFADVPLFWRLDLEICARSIGSDHAYDLDNPAARGEDWSMVESALANAVAAIKAHLRGRHAEASQLHDRAEQRIGLPQSAVSLGVRIERLVDTAIAQDQALTTFAEQVRALTTGVFGQSG